MKRYFNLTFEMTTTAYAIGCIDTDDPAPLENCLLTVSRKVREEYFGKHEGREWSLREVEERTEPVGPYRGSTEVFGPHGESILEVEVEKLSPARIAALVARLNEHKRAQVRAECDFVPAEIPLGEAIVYLDAEQSDQLQEILDDVETPDLQQSLSLS